MATTQLLVNYTACALKQRWAVSRKTTNKLRCEYEMCCMVACKIYFMFVLLFFAVYAHHKKYFYNKMSDLRYTLWCAMHNHRKWVVYTICSPLYINYNHKHVISVFLWSDAAAIFCSPFFCSSYLRVVFLRKARWHQRQLDMVGANDTRTTVRGCQ